MRGLLLISKFLVGKLLDVLKLLLIKSIAAVQILMQSF